MNDGKKVEEVRRIEVYDSSGAVVIETDTSRYIFNPQSAVEFANALLKAAEACGVKIQIQAERMPISTMKRATLINRTQHIMRSLQGKDPRYTAMQIVDTILAEV